MEGGLTAACVAWERPFEIMGRAHQELRGGAHREGVIGLE